MKELRAAVLGAGGMGRLHAKNLKSLGVTVAAICDGVAESAEALASAVGAKAYTCFDQMLAGEELDVLYICIPPFAHDGQFEKAAAKGIHVFIEKPIAMTTGRGASMVQATLASGIKTHVGFHMRYGSAVRALREMIEKGETGRPVLFNGTYMCNSLHSPWWKDIHRCGGQIFEQVIHVYDMCRFIFGEPQNTAGIMGNVCHAAVPGYTVEDVSGSSTRFSTGAVASITATNCAVPGRWDAVFSAIFEKVTVHFQDPDHATFHLITPDGVQVKTVETPVDHKLAETEAFLDIIREDKAPVVGIEEGYRSLCFVEAVVKSAAKDGKRVPVKQH